MLSKGKVTAREMAERFEVSQRTIYRDIEALSIAGIPVYTEKGKGGGISLLRIYPEPLPVDREGTGGHHFRPAGPEAVNPRRRRRL